MQDTPPSPQQPQNPYQNQGTQQPLNQTPTVNDGFAITSMVLGIIAVVSCYFGIIPGTLAVIFGHISLSKMKKDPQLGGKGMAIAGLATGYVGIAISIISSIMFLVAMNKVEEAGGNMFQEIQNEIRKKQQRNQ